MNRVLLVDEDPVFRLGLCKLLNAAQSALTIVETESFANAKVLLREVPGIALVILDLKLRDCGGFVDLFEMRSEFPEVPIIVLSTNADPESASRTMSFGAAGYISKSAPSDTIVQTVKTTLSGRPWAHGSIAARACQVNPIATLSSTQLRVLAGLKRGLRNKQIAFEMGVTEKTVKSYMSTLYRKLGVSSRTQALILLQEVLSNTRIQQVS